MAATRFHGRNARLFVDLTGSAAATIVPFIADAKIDTATARTDATAWGDTNMIELAGLPDFKGTYSGFADRESAQLYTAAVDGVPRFSIFYPDYVNKPSSYIYGLCFFDQSLELSVKDSAKITGAFSAGGSMTRIN